MAERIGFCQDHVAAGAQALGCFDLEDRLVAIGVMGPEVEPGVAQLAYLMVSRPYRRRGVGQLLFDRLVAWAAESGATQIYVSSASTEPAVSFYRGAGFIVTDQPIAELVALEPYDIHMRLSLTPREDGQPISPNPG